MTPRGKKIGQAENTFLIKAFQTPNAMVDDLMWLLTPEENTALAYTIRRIIGFGKRQDRISLTQYDGGTRDGEGNYLDHGTGMSHEQNSKALAALVQFHVLRIIQKGSPDRTGKSGQPTLYAVQMDSTKVDWDGLRARKEAKAQAGAARVAAARAAKEAKRQAKLAEPGDSDAGPGLSDRPGPSLLDRPGPGLSDRLNNKQGNTEKNSEASATPPPPATPKKGKKRESQADPRTSHPAIVAFSSVTGKRPKKETYDAIIERMGDQVDLEKLRAVFSAWCLAGLNPQNLGGVMDWYEQGIPERGPRKSAAPANEYTYSGPNGEPVTVQLAFS